MHGCMYIHFASKNEEIILSLSKFGFCHRSLFKFKKKSIYRQKTEKEQLAQVRVFGDCDVFMHEVLAQVIDGESKSRWEKRRGERMREYNIKRETGPTKKRRRSSIDDPAMAGAGVTKVQKRSKKK